MNGSPTCTVDFDVDSSSKVCDANPDAPWIPSFPVLDPTNINTLPTSPTLASTISFCYTIPRENAFTSGVLL